MPRLELLYLPVHTKSGQTLGVISDVILDPDTQSVVSYIVKPHRLLPAAIAKELTIDRSQVIGFDDTGMIVDDTLLRRPATSAAPEPAA